MTAPIRVQTIYDKGSGILNEDELLVKDNLFAVFDGATSLVKFINKKGETGGKLAAKISKKVFSQNKGTFRQLLLNATNEIANAMRKEGVDMGSGEALWSTQIASVRILKNGCAEFASIGDSLILAVYKDKSHALLVPYADHDLPTLEKWELLANSHVKDMWSVLKTDIDAVRRQANVTYGCLNGQKQALKFLLNGRIQLRNLDSLLLFTDGLFIPKENPDEPEDWDLFVDLYKQKGLIGILNYVRALEQSDKECWKYPRFKQHDDIAAIGIDF